MPRVTHLYHFHARHAKLLEFAGFLMPLYYQGIVDEHMAVREGAGIFDISHMGRFLVEGEGSTDFLEHLLPTSVGKVTAGRALYTLLLNHQGGIIDDLIVLRLTANRYLLVVNAANREKDLAWIRREAPPHIQVQDISDESGMVALQGPRAEPVLQRLVASDLSGMGRFAHLWEEVGGVKVLISRTGYTGEDGFELIVPDASLQEPEKVERLWGVFLREQVPACGLGARDTLRVEAGYCLYGADIDEQANPFEAGLGWVVDLDKLKFVGREELLSAKDSCKRVRVGFIMREQGIPRRGYPIIDNEREIGLVTSGTFSPLLKKGVAMGYVLSKYGQEGSCLKIQIPGEGREAVVKSFPLYDTKLYGWKRQRRGN